MIGYASTVGDTELAVSVHHDGAHQMADPRHQLRIGLAPFREAFDDVFEQPHGTIGPREDQLVLRVTASLLSRHIARETFEIRGLGSAAEECVGGIPRLGDDTVGTHLFWQRLRTNHEGEWIPSEIDGIDGPSVTRLVDLTERTGHPRADGGHLPDERPHEAQPGGECGSHAREAHDLVRRTQRRPRDRAVACGHVHGGLLSGHRPRRQRRPSPALRTSRGGLPVRRSGRRNRASCRP